MRGRRGLAVLGPAVLTLAVVALAVPVAACGGGSDRSGAAGGITVSAAASLTGAFGTIKDQFVAVHPGATVTLNFGSSGTLETQIESGAPADVAAFADTATMDRLAAKGLLAATARTFATNTLTIVAKPGNPAHVATLADLATVGVVSLCVDTAPCGTYADQILAAAGVALRASSVTRGPDVRATLTAVSEGDAVAGIVYVTDALAAGAAVSTVAIPDDVNAVATYPIAVLKESRNAALARAFVDFVLGGVGRRALESAGFGRP